MNRGARTLFVAVLLFWGFVGPVERAAAHGEDKPGPHGGVIRMPGAFHTELIARGTHAVEVYLLDFNWSDPVVAESAVTVTHRLTEKEIPLECQVESKSFMCRTKGPALNEGTLVVHASRKGAPGIPVEYPLPSTVGALKGEPHH